MIEQLAKLAADLGGRLIFVGEIVFAFILKRCVMQLGEGVVLQSKFQRDLFAAVFRIAAAVYADRIRFGLGAVSSYRRFYTGGGSVRPTGAEISLPDFIVAVVTASRSSTMSYGE